MMKLLEVIRTKFTSDETFETLLTFGKAPRQNHRVVQSNSIPPCFLCDQSLHSIRIRPVLSSIDY